ncbi:MAG: protein kinase domain-containing protein [Gemmatimonadales bacterium]
MTPMPPSVMEALTSRYRVERELGAGGMATVYLAEDLKHHRHVALKVLKPELAAILGAERFLKEIEVTANLQHPNILPLYDSGEAASYLYYVMPFIEGESLRDRLNREKQLPVDEALRIADSVAAALQFAHEHGVVHRDIKPENILLQAGQALVADFGIALAVSQAGGTRLTETGLSLGTPHYMSPEQATGDRAIDARSDIYALGCVLYEMLAGEPPHLGNTVQAVVAKILTEEPAPVTNRRKTVPAHVDAAVRKALAKLPADRFASVAEFRAALGNASFTVPVMAAQATAAAAGWRARIAIPLALAAVALAALATAGWRRKPAALPRQVVRFEVPPPDSTGRLIQGAVTPDGGQVVLVQRGADSHLQFAVRDLSALGSRPLQVGDPFPSWPAFSHDGHDLAFVSLFPGNPFTGRLKVLPSAGGPATTLADSAIVAPSWGDDGYIYFSAPSGTSAPARLVRVPSTGGHIDTLLAHDSLSFYQPRVLPGSRGAIATAGAQGNAFKVVAVDLQNHTWHALDDGGRDLEFAPPDYVLYNKGRFLMAARLDLKKLKLIGSPVPLLEASSGDFGWFDYRGGTLMYQSISLGGTNVPVLVDRHGARRPLPGLPERQSYGFPAVSPDGRKIALRMNPAGSGQQQMDIWVYELPAGPLTRLTFEGRDDDPDWTPDGKRILFDSDREGGNAFWITAWDGSGKAERILDRPKDAYHTSWLPGGREFLFDEQTPGGSQDIGLAVLGQPDSTRMLLTSPFSESWPAASPDGRWLAYQSDESGSNEVYLRPLRGEGTRRQVSRHGGAYPMWARSGRELFFESGAGDSLLAARIDVQHDGAIESVDALFPMRTSQLGFDVFPGDSLFIVFDPPQAVGQRALPVVVVHNFDAELEARMRAGRKP